MSAIRHLLHPTLDLKVCGKCSIEVALQPNYGRALEEKLHTVCMSIDFPTCTSCRFGTTLRIFSLM